MVLVSHDRYLLRACCDQFLILSAHALVEFDGDLDDYYLRLREERRTESDKTSNRPSAKADRRAAALQRQLLSQRRRPLERELTRLEGRIDTLQSERDALQLRLSDNNLYSGAGSRELQVTLQRHGQLGREIEVLEMEWLRIGEALELVE
jgi:ATP-binding cassette subfamily F protein 3